MKVVEIVLAVLFAALGVRSVIHWVRRPFASQDMTDQVLFALFVTARAGWWFAASGLFALYATMGEQGDVAVTVRRYDWYLCAPDLLGGAAVRLGIHPGPKDQ